MQRSEVLEFLAKINSYLGSGFSGQLGDTRGFGLKIFGKSALMLAGLQDSVGTVDIDILVVQGQLQRESNELVMEGLKKEFGRARIQVHGYYLEFVLDAVVFLPQQPRWIALETQYSWLSVEYLDPTHVAASKLFSAFSDTPRNQDKQDIRALLDQKLVTIEELSAAADNIFDFYMMDSRSDRFPEVYSYLVEELMADYGEAKLEYEPRE
jgi:hypothetical protein